jgi:demethylmenaquinone methyltransferase/2-methoxy-6-polyprenyl-1,4-benzoquinol methylase
LTPLFFSPFTKTDTLQEETLFENGFIFKIFVDPILKTFREEVASLIPAGSKVLDVACGTGAQVFEIARSAERTVGIDFTPSMIKTARRLKNKKRADNVEFFVTDAADMKDFNDKEFDYAILSLALHQFSPFQRTQVVKEINRVAKNLIIADYAVPLPKNLYGLFARFLELLAGPTHFKNFRSFYRQGGTEKILPAPIQRTGDKSFASGVLSVQVYSISK